MAAAVAIVHEHGLAGLTMRTLAERLSVSPMALYRHVGDREQLARLVIEDLFSRLAFPDDALDAIAWLRALAIQIRALGHAHHGVMDVLLEEGPVVRSTLVILDRVVTKLHAAGLDWPAAAAIHNTFTSWLAATVRREERWASRREGAAPMARFLEAARAMPAAEHPGLAHLPGDDVDTEFERSLAFMLDGVAARIASAR